MIDLHIHLLPGVDDGPGTLDEAVTMCRRAAEDGCSALVTTPHQRHEAWWNGDLQRLEARRTRLQDELGGTPRIYLGGEVRANEGLLEDLDRGPAGGVASLAGGSYLLVEFSRFIPDPDPTGLIHELAVAGWRPVLAHVEEIRWLAEDPELIGRLVGLGAMLQVTGQNVLGRNGRTVERSALDLLDAGLVHFLASDAHNLETRPPGLSEARALVARHWGDAVGKLLTEINPGAVVEDRPLPAPDEVLTAAAGEGEPARP
ncbi:MAG: hypothetical protein PVG07_07835 [Acidobacteriota bacterium]|jgi:protein-tyrosine phosphatase